MKATKKLTWILAVLAMVMMNTQPGAAIYSTTNLTRSSQFILDARADVGDVAVTIYWLKQGTIVDIDLLVSPNGLMSIPRRAERAVFEASGAGGTGLFRVSQNGVTLEEVPIGGTAPLDVTVVFDIS